jgi:AcrR family transcriptional regulator
LKDDGDRSDVTGGQEAGGAPAGLPPSFLAAWGRPGQPRRGPKPGLTVRQIVRAAISVAASEGLDAVSMARLAADLGTSTMALYRYVGAKDELLELMVDEATGPCPVAAHSGGWREGLANWAWAQRAVIYQHSWILRIPSKGLPVTPNRIRWLELCLSFLEDTGLSWADKCAIAFLLSMYVRAEAMLMTDIYAGLQSAGGSAHEAMSEYGKVLADLTSAGDFPALTAAIDAGVFTGTDPPATQFAFGLERILDGIEYALGRVDGELSSG